MACRMLQGVLALCSLMLAELAALEVTGGGRIELISVAVPRGVLIGPYSLQNRINGVGSTMRLVDVTVLDSSHATAGGFSAGPITLTESLGPTGRSS